VIFIDTFEKLKDISVSTTLHSIANELTSSSEAYELSFEEYLTLILKFLYTNSEKAEIKTIIAGRDSVNKNDNIGHRYIKQSEVNKFTTEQIREYLEQKDFDLPDDNIINEIQNITKGNPLILHYLTEFIFVQYENNWTWDQWNELVPVFSNSDDDYGLIYYLTERIAKHIGDWENTLWKLAIPLELNPEMEDILYPKMEDKPVYGKKYFKLLQEKGILKKGKGDDQNYYLFNEVKASLNAYIKKEFGKHGNNWLDNEQIIELHKNLLKHYYELAHWDEYPKEFTDNFLSSGNKLETMNKQELFFASFHAFASKQNFEKKFVDLGKNRFEFRNMFIQSFLTTLAYTCWVADNIDNIPNQYLNEVISNFTDEIKKYEKLYSKDFNCYLQALKMENKLPDNWNENENFLLAVLKLFPNESQLLTDYALFLKNIKKDYEKAEEYYLKAIEANTKDENANLSLGFFYIQKGNIELAEKYLLKSVELGSLDLGNMNLGHVYFAKGEKEKALKTYKLSIANFEDKDEFIEGFVDDYQVLKQYGITKEEYDEIENKLQ